MMLNRVSLNTIGLNRIGLNRIGKPSRGSSDRPYIDPEVLASLKAVCICYGKSNDDPDRAIVKNLVDPDNPFVISNAAYKLNSGYGLYATDFTTWIGNASINIEDKTKDSFHITNNTDERKVGLGYNLVPGDNDFEGYKIKVEIIKGSGGEYKYYDKEGHIQLFALNESKIYTLPTSYNSVLTTTEFNAFFINPNSAYKITQIPSYQGAFVTDGVDDLITSTKTVQDMLGGSNEITVVSMINQIADRGSTYPNIYNNQIRYSTRLLRSTVTAANVVGKTGIYGYTATGVSITGTPTGKVVNDILGDKNDYPYLASAFTGIDAESHFSVEGYLSDSGNIIETSKVAWYWTVIANKVLTTDQINQVIAYFNLDKTLKPDILCNTIKQGISNENHAEFGDKLIDFSGNGRDIQLNNIAWKGDSGIGKYVEDFTTWYGATGVLQTFSKIEVTDGFKHNWVINRRSGESAINSFKVLIKGIPENGYIQYRYFESEDATKKSSIDIYEDGEYSLPNSTLNNLNDLVGFQLFAKIPPLDSQSFIGLTITQIPSHAGSLCLDGINDFGKVTGMPIYKDYTFIIDYERISYTSSEVWTASVVSKAHTVAQGAFILMAANRESELSKQSNSFGSTTTFNRDDFTRTLLYQSKYKCGDVNLTVGEGIDGDTLWLGTLRDNDYRFFNGAIYSLMSFPYSMSEFLIERQLKKYKLGTLYPDMVEFRPVIKANNDYEIVYTAIIKPDNWQEISIGDYVTVGKSVAIQIKLNLPLEVTNVSSNSLADVSFYKEETGDNVYTIYGRLLDGKSPQKINMIISSYLTMLNNETLISNETLIKKRMIL